MTPRARAPFVVGAVVALLLSGCSNDEPPTATDRLLLEYGNLEAGSLHVESGEDSLETIVQLDADATVDEITALIVGHPGKVQAAGLAEGDEQLRFLTDAGPMLTMRWVGDPDEGAVRDGVSHWFLVNALVGPQVQLVLDSDGAELYGVHGDSTGWVRDAFREIGADPVLGADYAVWDVTATAGASELRFAINGLPTDAQLATWDALVASLGKLPVDHAASSLDVTVASRATVRVSLSAPPGTTALSPQGDSELLWPALHDQLDAVPGLHSAWEFVVNWATTDQPTSVLPLVSLHSDQRRPGPTDVWNRAAFDYVSKGRE
ncbi:MAG TPA: hypothetical protein VLI04_07250 [Nocardioidaceae bacterium]|nr:hypothetical protein [Nocardioidaceae bacterium]